MATALETMDRVDHNLADLDRLMTAGVSEHDAESFLAWRAMELDGMETDFSKKRLRELRLQYGEKLLAQVR